MDEDLDIADESIIMRDGQIEQMATPSELIEHQATDFVREFIGADRIARQRDFGQQRLIEFTQYYDESWDGEMKETDGATTVREAISLLDRNPKSRLAVMKDGKVLGYIGHHSLLQAAMKDREGARSL